MKGASKAHGELSDCYMLAGFEPAPNAVGVYRRLVLRLPSSVGHYSIHRIRRSAGNARFLSRPAIAGSEKCSRYLV